MSEHFYVKHPTYMGKQLSLHVGGGQQTIFDNSILEGAKYQRYAGQGFLRRCTPEEVAQILKGRQSKAQAAAARRAAHEEAQLKKTIAEDEKKKVETEARAPKLPDPKPPGSRREMLEAMDDEALYAVAQAMDLSGRSKLKGKKEQLVDAILSAEEAEEKAAAAETKMDPAPADPAPPAEQPKDEGTVTKSPASKVKAG